MNLPKILGLGAFSLFIILAIVALWKYFHQDSTHTETTISYEQPIEINLSETATPEATSNDDAEEFVEESVVIEEDTPENIDELTTTTTQVDLDQPVPTANRVEELFSTTGPKLDIVETVTYHKKVPWLKGRPAWIVDYANHYETPRYFISRSLAGKPDYFYQNYANGDQFNVFKKGKKIEFYLLVDLVRSKMWLYSLDNNVRTMLKTYNVCLGRPDKNRYSGYLSPLGKYTLGQNVTVYKPGMTGYFQQKKIEMVSVFGSRWIPFDKSIGKCSDSPKGLGIHGTPWVKDPKTGNYVPPPKNQDIGKYQSDGCIRLATQDMEELYAIITSKPTTIEIVDNFYNAKLPGKEL